MSVLHFMLSTAWPLPPIPAPVSPPDPHTTRPEPPPPPAPSLPSSKRRRRIHESTPCSSATPAFSSSSSSATLTSRLRRRRIHESMPSEKACFAADLAARFAAHSAHAGSHKGRLTGGRSLMARATAGTRQWRTRLTQTWTAHLGIAAHGRTGGRSAHPSLSCCRNRAASAPWPCSTGA